MFPCVINIVKVIHRKNPIMIGVDVIRGTLRKNTPLCVPGRNNLFIGKVSGIQVDGKSIEQATKETGSVAIRLVQSGKLNVGQHF